MSLVLAPLVSLIAAAPPELGTVRWLRDFEAATSAAVVSGKPLLVLFDEVPGCQTVLGFGKDVLSDPELVAIIEAETVPVAVYNNVGGADLKVLESFREPTWNNPVVRIIDPQRRALAPRYAGPYTRQAFARTLATGLAAAGRAVPERLKVIGGLAAAPPAPVERATFAMGCFWEGEAQLGAIEGVVAAQVGFLDGREVVEVTFAPDVIGRRALIERAKAARVASQVYARSEGEAEAARAAGVPVEVTSEALRRSEKDAKYYLGARGYPSAGLTELEALKINAALRLGQDPAAARALARR